MNLEQKLKYGVIALSLVSAISVLATSSSVQSWSYNPAICPDYKYKRTRPGVVLIDMQDSFLREIDPEEKDREIPNMLQVLEAADINCVPVIVLEYAGHGPTVGILKDKLDSLNTPVAYITKKTDDGFYQTEMSETLRALDIDELVLMGIYASACVLSTGQGALEHGFRISTSRDLIANPQGVPFIQMKGPEGSTWYQIKGAMRNNHAEIIRTISARNSK